MTTIENAIYEVEVLLWHIDWDEFYNNPDYVIETGLP